jgi:signal transduction histidine kinase
LRKPLNKWLAGRAITTKITVLYGLMFAGALVLFSVILFLNAVLYYRNASLQELEEMAERVTAYIAEGGPVTQEALTDLRMGKNIEISVKTDGAPVVNTSGLAEFTIADSQPPGYPAAPQGKVTTVYNGPFRPAPGFLAFLFNFNSGIRYMASERYVDQQGARTHIMVFRPFAVEQKILRTFSDLFVLANILGVASAFLIGRYIGKVLLKPISAIRQTAAQIGVEDLSRRIVLAEGPEDEVKKLALTFNGMIARLEASFAKQSQFISDASHELRTPISIIQGYANLIDRWGKSDPTVLQESIDSIKNETEHMSTLVKKLLFLARDERDSGRITPQPVNLGFLAAEVIKEAAVMEVGCELELREDVETVVSGDFGLLKQMIWIFIENGKKYCETEPCRIMIRIYKEGGHPCLSVTDNGIGIRREDLPFIFERFYRADKSRSHETSGTGLGLSIAEWIVKQHGASVRVESVLRQGTTMIVTFPAIDRTEKP